MKGFAVSSLAILVLTSIGMLLSGCVGTSAPARFYTLSAIETADRAPQGFQAPDGGVGVGPLSIPDYLDRQQMVVRSGRNEIQVAEYHLWAGSLQDEMLRVLSANLARLLSADRVYSFPWSRSHLVAYTIPLKVREFDGTPGGRVSLRVQWTVMDSSRRVLVTRESEITEDVGSHEYAALAAAHSRALGRLAGEIASALGELPREQAR